MAGIKHEEKIYFPDGHVYVLMDEDWGVEINGEDGIDGDLTTMGSWDFKTREAWEEWGNAVINSLNALQKENLSPESCTNRIYGFDQQMPEHIRAELVAQ